MEGRRAVIQFVADVEEAEAKRLLQAVHAAVADGVRELVILLSSIGGNTYWGTTLHNVLRGVPAEVTTFNIGHASSIAATVFCAGRRRLCVPHAKFILHRASALAEPEGRGPVSQERLEERLASIKADTRNIASILARTTGRSLDDVLEDLHQRRVLDAQEALQYGLVHEIREPLWEAGARVSLIT